MPIFQIGTLRLERLNNTQLGNGERDSNPGSLAPESTFLATVLYHFPKYVHCGVSRHVQAPCTYGWHIPSTNQVRVCLSCDWSPLVWGGEAELLPVASTPTMLASFHSFGLLHTLFLSPIKLFPKILQMTGSFSCFLSVPPLQQSLPQ